jgi:hypothetical protein
MTASGFMPTREEYERLLKENEQLQARILAAETFHPRAIKLIKKRKNFVVVAEDEPYFRNVYFLIKVYELSNGTWTDEDEQRYQAAIAAHEALKENDNVRS